MGNSIINKPIISSDSHIMEPPDTYIARIDHKYKDTAPRVVWQEKGGDVYVIDGMKQSIPMGLVAAAGVSAEGLATLQSAMSSRLNPLTLDPRKTNRSLDRRVGLLDLSFGQ